MPRGRSLCNCDSILTLFEAVGLHCSQLHVTACPPAAGSCNTNFWGLNKNILQPLSLAAYNQGGNEKPTYCNCSSPTANSNPGN